MKKLEPLTDTDIDLEQDPCFIVIKSFRKALSKFTKHELFELSCALSDSFNANNRNEFIVLHRIVLDHLTYRTFAG